ncbi:hypothetical protein FPV67DRAFT_1656080 [Lyophyllum atratum]|nr:hypothetical protein FPV67DRAFT_1656080 [Lyophyllum atratum]
MAVLNQLGFRGPVAPTGKDRKKTGPQPQTTGLAVAVAPDFRSQQLRLLGNCWRAELVRTGRDRSEPTSWYTVNKQGHSRCCCLSDHHHPCHCVAFAHHYHVPASSPRHHYQQRTQQNLAKPARQPRKDETEGIAGETSRADPSWGRAASARPRPRHIGPLPQRHPPKPAIDHHVTPRRLLTPTSRNDTWHTPQLQQRPLHRYRAFLDCHRASQPSPTSPLAHQDRTAATTSHIPRRTGNGLDEHIDGRPTTTAPLPSFILGRNRSEPVVDVDATAMDRSCTVQSSVGSAWVVNIRLKHISINATKKQPILVRGCAYAHVRRASRNIPWLSNLKSSEHARMFSRSLTSHVSTFLLVKVIRSELRPGIGLAHLRKRRW